MNKIRVTYDGKRYRLYGILEFTKEYPLNGLWIIQSLCKELPDITFWFLHYGSTNVLKREVTLGEINIESADPIEIAHKIIALIKNYEIK